MKQSRLENLADGIFSIVMTLLVLELKVPVLADTTAASLSSAAVALLPYVMSYITSFAVLYIFWHSHHFLLSVYAKSLTVDLSTLNGIFLFFIGLIPFSSHLLARYNTQPFAIIFFSVHIIILGLLLYYVRYYIKYSKHIENIALAPMHESHFKARLLFPVFCSLLAIIFSFISPMTAVSILTLGILFNFSRKSTRVMFSLLKVFPVFNDK